MSYTNVADLTIDEFINLIQEVVTETILELFGDPDEGLELREEIKERLRYSLAKTQVNRETRSVQDVATNR